MRRVLACFVPVAVLALAGTVPAAPAQTRAGDAGASDAAAARAAFCARFESKLALPTKRTSCDDRACKAAGGVCGYAGRCFGYACIKRTRDAGFRCTDGSQCESACLAPRGARPGPGSGTCSPTQITLGCHAFVIRGRVGRVVCGD
jgi:hypothetical protein